MSKIGKNVIDMTKVLEGNMEVVEYKNYILTLMFYETISEKYKDTTKDTFKTLLNEGRNGEYIIDKLTKALKKIESTSPTKLKDIFLDLTLGINSKKFGNTKEERNKVVVDLLNLIDKTSEQINKGNDDTIGDVYEFLMKNFEAAAGQQGGEYFTPPEVSDILGRIVSHGKDTLESVYDPTCGSGGLLLNAGKYVSNDPTYYGQEKNHTNFNSSRMNMYIKGYSANIYHGDTLKDDKVKSKKFDAIVANPPYSLNWEHGKGIKDDKRFKDFSKLAPKSNADYAFVQHCLYHLKQNSTAAIVLPIGVLYRLNSEAIIRKELIDKNVLDAIITLPPNIFYGTSIETCLMILKTNRVDKDVLYIDATKEFNKMPIRNMMDANHIKNVLDYYVNRVDVKYENTENYKVKRLSYETLKGNDFNLNSALYVGNYQDETDAIDLDELYKDIRVINDKINTKVKALGKEFKDLDIPNPFE